MSENIPPQRQRPFEQPSNHSKAQDGQSFRFNAEQALPKHSPPKTNNELQLHQEKIIEVKPRRETIIIRRLKSTGKRAGLSFKDFFFFIIYMLAHIATLVVFNVALLVASAFLPEVFSLSVKSLPSLFVLATIMTLVLIVVDEIVGLVTKFFACDYFTTMLFFTFAEILAIFFLLLPFSGWGLGTFLLAIFCVIISLALSQIMAILF